MGIAFLSFLRIIESAFQKEQNNTLKEIRK